MSEIHTSDGADIQNVLEKAEKLFRMAEDISSPHEAQLAMVQLQRLLLKHHIDMEVLTGYIDLPQEQAEELDATEEGSYNRIFSALAHVIAQNFRCAFYWGFASWRATKNSPYSYRKTRTVRFVGLPTDLKVAVYMFHAARRAMDVLSSRYIEDFYAAGKHERSIRYTRLLRQTWKDGFIQGLDVQFAQARAEMNSSTALILVTPPAVGDHMSKLSLKSMTSKMRVLDDSEVKSDGYNTGLSWKPNVLDG